MAEENDPNIPAGDPAPAPAPTDPAPKDDPAPTPPAPDVSELTKKYDEMMQLMKEGKEARKQLERENAQLKETIRQAELERLKAEGKAQEALEKELADRNAKIEWYEKRNQELTRDHSLNEALNSYTFLNKNAREMAFHQLVSKFRKNEEGDWYDLNGNDIETVVKMFTEDPANSFLMKGASNSGTGSSPVQNSNPPAKASLKDYSIQELIAKAKAGTLRK